MKYITLVLGFFMTMFMGCLAIAQEVKEIAMPEELSDIGGIMDVIAEGIKNSNSLLYGAGITLILVLLIKKYVMPKLSIGNGTLPFISIGVGIIAGLSLAIVNGGTIMEASLAIMSGPLASTLWDAVAKYFFKKE